jgi:hypothetical protein
MSLDQAQDAYRAKPSRKTAKAYVNELVDYYLDYQIGKDTFYLGMAEVAITLKPA